MNLKRLVTAASIFGLTTLVYAKPATLQCWVIVPAGSSGPSIRLPPAYFVIDAEAKTIFKNGVKLKAEWNELSIMTREGEKVFPGVPVLKRSFVSLLHRHNGDYTAFWEYTKDGKLIDFDELERLARARGIWNPNPGGLEGIAEPEISTGKCEVSRPAF